MHLDPLILAKISQLELRARTVVEGFINGLHQSHTRGVSLEFAQHRTYAAGDEIKHIDWKVYARQDRLFVKQFEEETTLKAYAFIDNSGSMAYKGEKSALSKYDYASTLLASLAYLTLHQGDSIGLARWEKDELKVIPAHNQKSHLNVLLADLAEAKVQNEPAVSKGIELLAHSIKKRSLVLIVSDFMDDADEILKCAKFLQFKKNEVILLHVLDPDEYEFPFAGSIRFDSMEKDEHLLLDARAYRKEYRAAIRSFTEKLRVTFQNYGMRYTFHQTNEPVDAVLRALLKE